MEKPTPLAPPGAAREHRQAPTVRAVLPRIAVALALVLAAAPAAAARVRTGPAGDGFYAPPRRLVAGPPGTVVWARPSTGLLALPAAARTMTVIFRSRSLTGRPIVESGTVAIPNGEPPAGGWPLVSWFHVTTGAADVCAPSRVTADNTERERMTRADAIVSHLLRAGVAVARPDGEGIGTPGGHPYLIGASLARSQADIARAARRLDPRIGTRWAAAGHSEGGVASLWSAALGARFAPDLQLVAVAAFSPVTRTRTLLDTLRYDPVRSTPSDGLSSLASLIITGAAESDPVLKRGLTAGALSDAAARLLPDVGRRCLNDLTKHDSWGGLAPADIPGPRYDGEFRDRFDAILDANDPRAAALGTIPVRIDQGMADAVEPAPLTEDLVAEQRARGADITYTRWPTATHVDITADTQAGPAGAAWLVAHLAPHAP